MFAPGAIKPWKTKPGHSKLDALVAEVTEKHLTIDDVKRGDSVDKKDAAVNVEKV